MVERQESEQEAFEAIQNDVRWFIDNYDSLKFQYKKGYVAVLEKQVIAHSKSKNPDDLTHKVFETYGPLTFYGGNLNIGPPQDPRDEQSEEIIW
ncbi:MAG: hypothetical protein Q7S56_01410 [Nanoarchaeota archaeon]|nr:hypothetical protein [Nanoarchaeota archaeon]